MSPAPAVIQLMTGGRRFDPEQDITNLGWLLDVDYATDIISGEINSIVDRKAGVTFAALTAGVRMPLNTTERPEHQVAQNAGGDQLHTVNAIAAAIEGNTDCTFFQFWRPTSFSSGSSIIEHRNSSQSRYIRASSNTFGAGAGYSMGRASASASETVPIAFTKTMVWQLDVWTYTAATQTLEVFLDNVSKGTATFTNAVAPTSVLTQINWGISTGYYSLGGVTTDVMSATIRTGLFNYVTTSK